LAYKLCWVKDAGIKYVQNIIFFKSWTPGTIRPRRKERMEWNQWLKCVIIGVVLRTKGWRGKEEVVND
jgi:hypothetical protein